MPPAQSGVKSRLTRRHPPSPEVYPEPYQQTGLRVRVLSQDHLLGRHGSPSSRAGGNVVCC